MTSTERYIAIDIAQRLREARHYCGYSQEQVYKATRVHVARLETGKRLPGLSSLIKLCRHYKIDIDELFAGVSINQ